MATSYDWKLEEVQTESDDNFEAGEILDFEHSDGDRVSHLLDKYILGIAENNTHFELCLVKYVGSVRDGVTDMYYAYVGEDLELPTKFCDALGREVADVPAKYHKMLNTIKANQQ
ncbi:MAG: hypothetical protein ACRCXB_02770 [Aeromonadaceae bacterium]